MLVIDAYTLQTIDVLNLVNNVMGQGFNAFQAQNVMRVGRTVGNNFTLLDVFTFEHGHLAPFRNQHFVVAAAVDRVHTVSRGDDQATLALSFLTEADSTGDFRQDGRLFRFAGFEQVGNTRQTTGDVTGLGTFLRDTGDNVTDIHLLAVFHTHDSLGREEVMRRYIGTRQILFLAFAVEQGNGRTQFLAAGRTLGHIHHGDVGQTGDFVGLALHAQAFFHGSELHLTGNLDHDRVRMRVPGGNDIASLDFGTVGTTYHGTIRQFITFFFTTIDVVDNQLTGAADHNQVAIGTLYCLHVEQMDGTVRFHLHVVTGRGTGCGTTNMEGTHGQLGTRLTDGLGSYNTHGLTDVGQMATGQVTTITFATDTEVGFTGNR